MGRRRACAATRRRGIAALLSLAVVVGAITAPAALAAEGYTTDGETRYRVDPAERVVHVEVTLNLANHTPSRRRGAYIETPYLDSFVIPAIGPVRRIAARSSAGGRLATSIKKMRRGLNLITVDLSPNLVYGAPQEVTVRFDLPGQPARSPGITRVNHAFAGWSVIGMGDPGKIDIVIDVPKSFELMMTRPIRGSSHVRGRRRVHRFSDIRKLANAEMFASAADDTRLDHTEMTVDGTQVTIKAWPDDPRWAKFAGRTVERGLPALQQIVGRDVHEDQLTVLESSRSYQFGYAGMYDRLLGVVEVGDELDQLTVLHELSHIWLNDTLFIHRWITEGLAEEAANQALEALGESRRPPPPIRRRAPGAIRLNDWSNVIALGGSSDATEVFAYGASYNVMQRIARQMGPGGLARVVDAAAEAQIAYQGDPAPEPMNRARDWRYFYDLVELVGGADDLDDIFTAHVVTPEHVDTLAHRRRARATYDVLVAAGEGWSPPLEVRRAMSNWSFDTAESLMRRAEAVVNRSGKYRRDLSAAGIDAAAAMEAEYESAPMLSAVEKSLDAYDQAAQDAAELRARQDARGPLLALGLIGVQLPNPDRPAVVEDADAAVALLASANAGLDNAARRGVMILVAALLLLAAAVVLVWRRRLSARRLPQTADAPDG